MILDTLCNLNGVSGNEDKVREFIFQQILPYADDITTDVCGNMIAYVKGKSSDKKIMFAAHMDEVGAIVSQITDEGYLKFKTVGGIDERILPSKRVLVGDNDVLGVIGLKAIHLQDAKERKEVAAVSSLVIDIGAQSRTEALKKVSIGDYVAFKSEFASVADNTRFKGKAIDDRCGCAILTELIKEPCLYDTYFAFTVQEEVGTRGAFVCANRIKPDIAIIFEATTCSDVSNVKDYMEVTNLDGGAALSIADNGSYSDVRLTKALYNLAVQKGILVQYKRTTAGGNDARVIQTAPNGVRTAVISLPCRYLHSPIGLISKSDFKSAGDIAKEFLKNVSYFI